MMTLTNYVCVFTFNLHNLQTYLPVGGLGSQFRKDASLIVS